MMQKQSSLARRLAWDVLQRVENEAAFADILITQTLSRNQLIPADNALLNELVRGVLRWKKRLAWISDQLWQNKTRELDPQLRLIVMLGLYQIIYLDRVPDFACVDESVNLARSVGNEKWAGVVNAMLRNYLRNPEKIVFPDPTREPIDYLHVEHSHPRWLVELWVQQFGYDGAHRLCAANNQVAPLSMRINSLRIPFAQFCAELTAEQILFSVSKVPGYVTTSALSFELQKRYMEKGWITIQDESAGLPNFLFCAKPKQWTVDLCAAPGGKTSHCAERSADRSAILAMDVHTGRTQLVRSTIRRLGLQSVQLVRADAGHPPIRSAAIVLLDAPCSGLGVLRRKPDLRWRRKPAEITALSAMQRRLLHAASQQVASGGTLIYSTCTIHPRENREQIKNFLSNHREFRLQPAGETEVPAEFISADGFVETWPHRHGMDGSFAAKLIKQ